MRGRYAAYAVVAVLGAPAGASAADATVDAGCYAENTPVKVTGSGYTPNSIATLTLDGTTSSVDTDASGEFSATLTAPLTTVKHHVVQQFALGTRDVDTGADTNTMINVVKIGVDTVPEVAKPHSRLTWYFSGYPSQKALYGHWRFGGKTRANRRMGQPQGPCGVLKVRARMIPTKRIRFGRWTVQFDHNRTYDKHAQPKLVLPITIYRTFG